MSKERKRKGIRWRAGSVVQINLGDGSFAFGRLLEFPLVAFYDRKARCVPAVEEIVGLPIAFKIWVMKYAVNDGDWPIIGYAPLEDGLLEKPWFFKQDPINGKLTLYQDGGGPEIPASLDDCRDLECAAVWDPEHAVDRLNDHFVGRPNDWVESLRLKTPSGAERRR